MDILTLQNFYKDSVKVAWTAGSGNFYVNTKPVPTSGILVVNPSSTSKREIIRYSAVGTDGTGDYITVSSVADRGLGGTTAQVHAVDEPIRMNITAEHWDNIQDAIDQLQADLAVAILAGASFASPTVAGIARLTNAPDKSIGTVTISIATPGVISRTAHGMLVNDRVKFTTTGALPTGIVASTEYYVIGTGLTADAFQISATLGGTAINTSGGQSGVHTLVRTTPYVVEDNDARIPTTAEKARIPSVDEDAAMAGTVGVPNTDNKYATENNSSASGTDQEQTTQNSSVELGEANATTKKNKIAQSFKPTKNKIRGVKLYKSANTGTAFTGTVTVTLQSDSSGSPDGTPLATKVFTNSQWAIEAVGEIEALFATEYASLLNVPETTYWIVVETSTSDNSNHPNLGFNTAGGYTNGTLKYNNTSDGWVEITGDDLYFKTLEGNVDQNVKTDSAGKIPKAFFDPAKMPFPGAQQTLKFEQASGFRNGASNKDGSVFVLKNNDSTIIRFQRDAITGHYYTTHTGSVTSSAYSTLTIIGDYIYYFYDPGNEVVCKRYDLADFGNATTMTMPTYDTSGANYYQFAWNDGTHLYLNNDKQSTTYYKLVISGTTLTQSATGTCLQLAGTAGTNGNFNWFDGENVYVAYGATNAIKKLDNIAGSSVTTIYDAYISSITSSCKFILPIDSDRVYVGTFRIIYDQTTQIGQVLELYPFSKV